MTLAIRRSTTDHAPSRFRRARTGALAAIAAAGLLLAGCGGDDDKVIGPTSITGTYNVTATKGPQGTDNSAPFVLLDQTILGVSYRLELASGTLVLGADKRYTGSGIVNAYVDGELDPENSGESFPSDGSYAVNGTTVTFTPDDETESPRTATLSGGNTLTFSQTEPGVGTFSILLLKQ